MNRFAFVTRTACLLALSAFATPVLAQLHGVNPFVNDADPPESRGLFDLDYDTGVIVDSRQVTLAGFTVTGLNSITIDPTSGTYYAILKVMGVSGRVLATIDPATGVAVEVGNLGDNFSSLSFRSTDGQLFGTTGDGATVSETLFMIDKTTAVTTLATALGNGADGELIAYNPNDNHFYHWSGNSTIVYERVLAEPPYTVTDIPIVTPGISGESFGAVWDACRNAFLVHDINSRMRIWTTTGDVDASNPATIADVRGLALLGSGSCEADLGVSQVDSPDPVFAGDPLSYTVTVANAGPRPATNSVAAITLPAGTTFVSTTGCAEDPAGVPTCSLGNLANGATALFSIAVTVDAATRGTITNSVNVSSDLTDPDGNDNSSSEITTVLALIADLTLTKSNDVGGSTTADGMFSWTLELENDAGLASAEFTTGDILLRDQLPDSDVIYDDVVVTTSGAVTGTVACAISGSDLECSAATNVSVPVGGLVNVVVPVGPTAVATYANPRAGGICSADPDGLIEENNEGNNACADSVQTIAVGIFADGFEDPPVPRPAN